MLIGLKIAADKSEGFGTFKPSALQMLRPFRLQELYRIATVLSSLFFAVV